MSRSARLLHCRMEHRQAGPADSKNGLQRASTDSGSLLLQNGPGMWSILWNRVDSMETIQVVLDRKLLEAADRAARRTKQNRSALIRDALREYLRTLEVRTLEQRDRVGYSKHGQTDESRIWEAEASWPAE